MADIPLLQFQYRLPQVIEAIRDPLFPIRNWMNGIAIKDAKTARLICQIVPSRCPFERDVSIFGRTIHIPALCRINPLYEEVVALRLRSITYLSEECGENVTQYIT
ncbi:Mo-dependent nitrogenase C-terminal domain-containing protein [Pseudanabaena sp. PCC 6802]|uniref:Mo-dependent nitrogenase C-terminal domain-containing protein n=1 Tax=Pseudanabaena sp. PCC 6802 TaxID=118173 RepID=UPI000347EC04|nr:Mo-dependent nitrogenase C-terminal domain-containing protein [Pseudanabaena sp. PCC 6802]